MKDALVQLFATLERAGEGQDVTAARAARIKKLMAPFVLRRLKDVVLHGLLPRSEEDMLVPMSAPQQQLYADTLAKIAAQALERQKAWEAEGGEGAEGLGVIDPPSSRHRGETTAGVGLHSGEQKKWVRAAFTELRKVAQHPLHPAPSPSPLTPKTPSPNPKPSPSPGGAAPAAGAQSLQRHRADRVRAQVRGGVRRASHSREGARQLSRYLRQLCVPLFPRHAPCLTRCARS